MLAARLHAFGGLDQLKLEEVADPVAGRGGVVVRIAAAGLNRADTEFMKGVYGDAPRADAAAWDDRHFPHIPGIEAVGTVETTAADVEPFKPGDRVLIHSSFSCGACRFCLRGLDNYCEEMRVLGTQTPGLGAFAEQIAIPADRLLPLPGNLDFVAAATVGVQIATVWWMMNERASIKPGDVVLVQGASGGIGIVALRVARMLDARPIAVVRNRHKADDLLKAGAETVIIDDGAASVSEQLRAIHPRGADTVVEAVGGAVWPQSMAAVAQGGTIVVCGGHAGVVVPLNLGLVFGKQLNIVGSARAPKSAVADAIGLVAGGRLGIPIDRVYAFRAIHEALRRLEQGRHTGKIVVVMDEEATRATH
jgi:NADPH:quinone reductase-like Zn-dependent oxidoreductase